MRLPRSPDRANSNQTRDLQSFGDMVKHCRNSIKIGLHSPFGPTSPVEFEAFFQKIGLAQSNRLILVKIMSFEKVFGFAEVDENTDILIVTLQTKVIHVLSICSLETIYNMSREIQYA